jgi:hypothetical protein
MLRDRHTDELQKCKRLAMHIEIIQTLAGLIEESHGRGGITHAQAHDIADFVRDGDGADFEGVELRDRDDEGGFVGGVADVDGGFQVRGRGDVDASGRGVAEEEVEGADVEGEFGDGRETLLREGDD